MFKKRIFFTFFSVCLFLGTGFTERSNFHTLAPLSFRVKPVLHRLLEENILKLNNLRHSSEFLPQSARFISQMKPYFKGKIDLNSLKTLDDGRIELTLLEISENEKKTVVFTFSSSGKIARVQNEDGDILYQINCLSKVIDSLKNDKDDYSLDEYVFLSDLHGAYYRIIDLLAFKLKININEYTDQTGKPDYPKIEDDIVKKGTDFGLKLIVNGDLPDRAPDTLKAFRLVEKLDNAGLVHTFVNGNHDYMAQINMMGFHLPFYDNFQGIPKHAKSYVKNLPKAYDESKARRVKIKFDEGETILYEVDLNEYLITKKEEDQVYKTKLWWARKYRDFIKTANRDQMTKWKNLLGEFKQLFDVIENYENEKIGDFIKDENQEIFLRKWWGDLMGFTYEARVDVYTGARAVEMMPLSWWEERIRIFEEKIIPYYNKNGAQHNQAKKNAIAQMHEKLMYVRKKILQEIVRLAIDGDWTSIIIGQGINIGNYQSIEWYAADWIFHGAEKKEGNLLKGDAWGPSAVYERIMEVLEKQKAEKPWREGEFDYFDIYTIKGKDGRLIELPNCVNYVTDEEFEAMNDFFETDFKAYKKDIYGNTFMHAFPPIDEYQDAAGNTHYKASFTYKGEIYEGETFFEGLSLLEADIKDSDKPFHEKREALALYMSWFADATICCKPQHIKKYVEYGIEKILDPIGVNILFVGHNPLSQLGGLGIGINTKGRLFNADNDMSPKYKNMGLVLTIGARSGILVSGAEQKGNPQIKDYPRILNDEGKHYKGANQSGMNKKQFSKAVIPDLQKKLEKLVKYYRKDTFEIIITDNEFKIAS